MNASTLFLIFLIYVNWSPVCSIWRPVINFNEDYKGEFCNSYHYNYNETGELISDHVICRNMNIDSKTFSLLLNFSSKYIKHIAFTNSSITILMNEIFPHLAALTTLDLKNSNVSIINHHAFHGMAQLKELYLQNNSIQYITEGTFDPVTNLVVLDLSDNHLRLVKHATFSNLINLKILKLARNKLLFLEPDCFVSLKSLETLDLTKNKMFLDPFRPAFKISSENLNSVLASDNIFHKFPVAGSLTQLKFLDVSYNEWTKIDLYQFYTLRVANVNHNKIGIITTSAIADNECSSLEQLNLSFNLIKKIDKHTFQNLTRLQKLYLNNNQIRELSPGCFANLNNMIFLSLSFNLMKYLESGYFDGLENLTTLQLDHNKLFQQSDNFSFANLISLNYLYLDNNMLTTLNATDIVENMHKLKMITLNDNKWSCEHIFRTESTFDGHAIKIAENKDKEYDIVSKACPLKVGNGDLNVVVAVLLAFSIVLCIAHSVRTFIFKRHHRWSKVLQGE